jgi:hypothetical protein
MLTGWFGTLAGCSSASQSGPHDAAAADDATDANQHDGSRPGGNKNKDASADGFVRPWTAPDPDLHGFTPNQIASLGSGDVFLGGTPVIADATGATTDPSIARLDSTGVVEQLTNLFPADRQPTASVQLADIATAAVQTVAFTGKTTRTFPGETLHNTAGDVFAGEVTEGQVSWIHQIGSALSGTSSSPDQPYAVASDGYGSVVVVGIAAGTGTFPGESAVGGGFILGYDSFGALSWHKQIATVDGEQVIGFHSVAVDENANIYCAGFAIRTDGSTDDFDVYLLKLDKVGQEIWHTLSPADKDVGDKIFLATSAPGDTIYVGGTNDIPYPDGSQGFYGSQVALTRFDGSGQVVWTKTINSTNAKGKPGADTVKGIVAAYDGLRVFLTGDSDGSFEPGTPAPSTATGFVLSYDSSGTVLWTQRLPSANGIDLALAPGAALYVSTDYFDVKLWPMQWAIFQLDQVTGRFE